MISATGRVKVAKPDIDKYTFYTSAEYYVALKKHIDRAKAGDRIMLVTLWLLDDWPEIAKIVDSLEAAGKRGAHITLQIDAFHFLIKGGLTPGPAFFFGPSMRRLPRRFIKRNGAIDRLRAAGVHCQIINETARPFANPFKGRSHIKYTVVNDEVFIGGCNLSEAHFLDVMVAWQDKQVADWLCELSQGMVRTGYAWKALGGKDLEIPVDTTTTLLIDAGTRDQSIIMDRAHDIIDAAQKELLITYQYFPHGPTAKRLSAAIKRGVKLRVFYNHPSKHKPPLNIVYALGARRARRSGLIELSERRLPKAHQYLHAKVLTTENAALLSSHNYMITGVELGTAEIGIMSTNPAFIQSLNETVLRQLNQGVTA